MQNFITKRDVGLGLAFMVLGLLSVHLLFYCSGPVSVYFGLGSGIAAAVVMDKMLQDNIPRGN